jgi:hypothetical protein
MKRDWRLGIQKEILSNELTSTLHENRGERTPQR